MSLLRESIKALDEALGQASDPITQLFLIRRKKHAMQCLSQMLTTQIQGINRRLRK